ncbi:RNA pseudouridine synthase [bacterium]|nr:MAG: RNA pseudouridine synthase [bacterium]
MPQLPTLSFIDEYQSIGVLYEDNHILVIHKPRNIPVQSDDSGDESIQTLLQSYLKEKYQKPGNVFLGIVHRLDRPVSGIMVFAKTSKAASRLSEQFRLGKITKNYWAIVQGKTEMAKTLNDFLKKDSKTNTVSVSNSKDQEAKKATLHFKKISESDGKSLLEIDLETGRPHQIRVQLSHLGNPIIGDAKYGKSKGRSDEIELKSIRIGFEHPTTKEALLFEGLIPDSANWLVFH